MIPGNETATDTSHLEYFDAVVGTSMLMENSGRSRATATSGSTISLPIKKSGIFGTSSNLVNSIVGAGIIGIPYAFRESGLLVGVFLLILVSYLTGKYRVVSVFVTVEWVLAMFMSSDTRSTGRNVILAHALTFLFLEQHFLFTTQLPCTT